MSFGEVKEEPIRPFGFLPVPQGHRGQEQQEVTLPEGTPWDSSQGQEAERAQQLHHQAGTEGQSAPAGGRSVERGWARTRHCRRVLQEGQGAGWVQLWEISPSEASHSLPEAKGLWVPLPASSQRRFSTLGTVGQWQDCPFPAAEGTKAVTLVSVPTAAPAPRDSGMSPQGDGPQESYYTVLDINLP